MTRSSASRWTSSTATRPSTARCRATRLSLHLRFVHQPNFAELAAREASLILATIEVSNIKALFEELSARGVEFAQKAVKQVWGGTDFHVGDPDGNVVSFVQYRSVPAP